MSILNSLFHNMVHFACLKKEKEFIKLSKNLKKTQLNKLFKVTPYLSYDAFLKNEKVKNYEDFESDFLKIKSEFDIGLHNKIIRFEPTSGSTSKVKWIPYTKDFLKEVDSAFSPMMSELYKNYSFIKKGKHFWSLSWLPEELRAECSNDDSELLNPIKSFFFKRILSLDKSDIMTKDIHQSKLNSASALLSKDVSLISVWSPTYFIELINFSIAHKDELIPLLDNRTAERLLSLESFEESSILFSKEIVFSSWGQASAKKWLDYIKMHYKNFKFVEKGVWCTEGVITIPFKGISPLSFNSHFYEFLDIKTSKVVPSWEVEKRRVYQPIITTSSGLRRYHIEDNLEVVGFYNSVPCFSFIGRHKHSDMVGEKLSQDMVAKIISNFEEVFSAKVISFYANDKTSKKPRYEIYIDGAVDEEAEKFLEAELNKCFHYRQAIEKNQLDKCKLVYGPDSLSKYYERRKASGLIEGNIKIEPITFSI